MTDDPISDAKRYILAARASADEARKLALPLGDPGRGIEHDAEKHITRIERALGKERMSNKQLRDAVVTYGDRMTVLLRLVIVLGVVGALAFGAIAYRLQNVQSQFSDGAYTGCVRSNVQNAALLDLGKIITLARAQTSTSPRVRKAARDYIVQVRKLDPSMPATKALNDLAILLAGDRGKPADARELAAAEDDFIKRARQIEKPRDCARLFRP